MTAKQLKVIGKSIPIREARDKVTGRAEYVDDIKADYYVKILGSPHPHATIKSIDTSAAENLDGVKAVLTYKDVFDKLIQFGCHRPSRAMDQRVRYVGDYVAAVAAVSEAVAEDALDRIEVEYEVLPAVFDPEEAAKPDAPRLYPEGNDYAAAEGTTITNSNERSLQAWGDIGKGFEEADVIVEDHFDVTPQTHSALETHVCLARWHGDELTILNPTQCPWELRSLVADYFEMPESKVVVLSPNIGGGFGGKYTGRYQIIVCLLSRLAGGKPTKLTLTREEAQCHVRRPRGKLYTRLGAKSDGTMTALYLKAYFDIGAYGNFHGGSNGFHLEGGILSYKTPHARFEAYDMHTNHSRGECMRSVQVPFLAFAIESVVDEMAEKLGMDPVEFRLKNMPESGDMMPPSDYTENYGWYPRAKFDLYPGKQMMRQVLEKIGWTEKWKGFGRPSAVDGPKRRGVGLVYSMGYGGFYADGATKAQVVVHADGSATVYSGAQEVGQGINTTMCMLAAEALGLSPEDVSLVTGDTRSGQQDMINARSSHQLATDGHILLEAVEEAKQKLREMAAPWLDAKPEDIEISGKEVFVKNEPEKTMEIAALVGPLGAATTGTAAGPPGSLYPEVKPGFKAKQPMIMAAEVEVDVETGEVRPIKVVTGMFPGRMINRGIVRGQALGGAVQTLGMALWEEFRFDPEARVYLHRDFTDYRIPRALDVPEIETVLVEEVDEDSPPHEGLPYGGRGIGEMSAWGAVVIASAIYNATGVRMRKSPMTAETVLDALSKGEVK